MGENKETVDFFNNLNKIIKNKAKGMETTGLRLSKTDEGAIMNSKIDSMLLGEAIEGKIPTIEETVSFLSEREMKDILGEIN